MDTDPKVFLRPAAVGVLSRMLIGPGQRFSDAVLTALAGAQEDATQADDVLLVLTKLSMHSSIQVCAPAPVIDPGGLIWGNATRDSANGRHRVVSFLGIKRASTCTPHN